jgi:hypothetical protein
MFMWCHACRQQARMIEHAMVPQLNVEFQRPKTAQNRGQTTFPLFSRQVSDAIAAM